MRKETKTVVYDEGLRLEAFHFQGIMQPFPNHFHEYYVIGFVEKGERRLSCRNREYTIRRGDVILFNPGDNHACVQTDGGMLDYRGLNISKEIMMDLAEEITGKSELPGFSRNVISDNGSSRSVPSAVCEKEIASCLRSLHECVMKGSTGFGREEQLLFLLSLLLQYCGQPFRECIPECRQEIERACTYMEEHYRERICLDQICRQAGLSKSTLLRAFTRSKGITPYCYLENLRIGAAKKLLEQGIAPVDAALQTGFSDQSHFTNYFTRYIGLSPGIYREIFLKTNDTGGFLYEE